MTTSTRANPFFAARMSRTTPAPSSDRFQPVYAKLPRAPINASPVQHLTSLYHNHRAGESGLTHQNLVVNQLGVVCSG
jgi:hypothetical protein